MQKYISWHKSPKMLFYPKKYGQEDKIYWYATQQMTEIEKHDKISAY